MAEPVNPAGHEKYVDLVCEGGGVKGIGLVGAYSVLEENGYQVQNLAGTSAGAIVATLLAAGYSAAELREIILNLDFQKIRDTSWEDRIPFFNNPLSVLLDLGIYEGTYFHDLMAELLEAKGVRTFRDLVHPSYADQPEYRYKVRVIASDITGRCLLALPQDAAKLGLNPDDLSVALAVRMSMSIPIFFEPVRVRNPQTGGEHLVVDGGVLSGFPVWIFDSPSVPQWPTFGLRLVEEDPTTPVAARFVAEGSRAGVQAVLTYLKNIVQTMLEAHDRLYIQQADYARTITIPTLGVNSVDFDLTRDRALALYESGRAAAQEFLKTWRFEDYIAAFRDGSQRSRRQVVVEQMRAAGGR
ncbi:MAG TPA: patatin-like phospholipase family protein [Dehalococcoidia bacterium]|nr:patatin-like phospholipase family protein [Dehalococcoidia bacterium]